MHGQIKEYNIITASRQTNVNGNITTYVRYPTCPEKKNLFALVKPTHPMEKIETICASKQVEMERGR